jgi:hypothetical protein
MLPEGGHGDRGGGGRRGWRIRPPRALPRLASLGGEEVAVGSSVTTLEVLHENHRVGVCSKPATGEGMDKSTLVHTQI